MEESNFCPVALEVLTKPSTKMHIGMLLRIKC